MAKFRRLLTFRQSDIMEEGRGKSADLRATVLIEGQGSVELTWSVTDFKY